MKKVVTIGGATQDIFIAYQNPQMLKLYSKKRKKDYLILEEGSKIEIENLRYSTGGGATNSAASFSRLGFLVSTILKVGDDNQADLVIEKLKQENIDTSYIVTSKDLHTGTSIVIPSISGDRTILAYRGSNSQLKKADIVQDLIADADQIYITSLSGQSSKLLPYITQLAKKHKVPVATNPGISQLAAGAPELQESLAHIDIFILNSEEANEFMSTLIKLDATLKHRIQNTTNTLEQTNAPQLLKSPIIHQDISFGLNHYFTEILKRGPKIVVVTNGEEGVYVAYKNQIYFQPSIPAAVVSTLGAGDSFGSCFVASIASGKSIEEAMLYGVINSSSVIGYLDAKTGLLTRNELEKRAAQITTKRIIKFPLQ